MPKPINLVVACAENRVMGRNNLLPWSIPEDSKHFLNLTRGQIVVLGRICFETWPPATQDGRKPVVITRNRALAGPGIHVASSVNEALAIAEDLPGEIMVCGGQRIFEETLERAHRLYLTLVHAEVPGDVYFPEWRHLSWREIEHRESSDENYRFTFSTLEREGR